MTDRAFFQIPIRNSAVPPYKRQGEINGNKIYTFGKKFSIHDKFRDSIN